MQSKAVDRHDSDSYDVGQEETDIPRNTWRDWPRTGAQRKKGAQYRIKYTIYKYIYIYIYIIWYYWY